MKYRNEIKTRMKHGMKHFGDDGKRVYPVPTVTRRIFRAAEYSRTDTITSQNWEDIHAMDFRNITTLEKHGDVRSILVAMAKFYKLKVNEQALQL